MVFPCCSLTIACTRSSQYALELQRQIEEKDDEIAELTQNQTGASKGKRGGTFTQKEEMEALEAENEDLRSQLEAGQLTMSDMREQLSNANVRVTTLQNEKSEADKKIRIQTKRLEELEKEIVDITNRSRTAELQSKEISKQKSKNVQEVQQLWDENATLNDEVNYFCTVCDRAVRLDSTPFRFMRAADQATGGSAASFRRGEGIHGGPDRQAGRREGRAGGEGGRGGHRAGRGAERPHRAGEAAGGDPAALAGTARRVTVLRVRVPAAGTCVFVCASLVKFFI